MGDSGIDWLGPIPHHWTVHRLRDSVRGCINGVWGVEPNGRDDVVCVRVADFARPRLRVRLDEPTIRAVTPDERRRRLLKRGDLLIEKSGGGDLQPVGMVMLFDHDAPAVCSNFVARMPVAEGFDPGFLVYLHSHLYAIGINRRSIKQSTGIQNLDSAAYLAEHVAFPPYGEQRAIARFLDHAEQRIRRAIRAKQELIALLNEQKQAEIHRAVTLGLDSNVRLKPSGIEWLGDIPEHWDAPLNQRLFKEEIRPHSGRPETPLSLSQRNGLIATASMLERSLQTSSYDNWKVTIPGDLVLNRFKAHLGVFFSADLRGIVSFHYGVFAPRRPLNTKYFELLYHTSIYRAIYAGRSNGMTVGLQNLSNQNFYGVRSILPPLVEQNTIVAFAENISEKLDGAIKQAQEQVRLLREYQTRLIADVVTGKLDVRKAAARLPDEVGETELMDEIDVQDADESEFEDVTAVEA